MLTRIAGGDDNGKYDNLGGNVDFDKNNDRYYRLIGTCQEETRQESVKLINLGEPYIINSSSFYYKINPGGFSVLMSYTPLDKTTYKSRDDLLKARHSGAKEKISWKYLEKDDFQWVALSSLEPAIANKNHHKLTVDVLRTGLKDPFSMDTSQKTFKMDIELRPCFLRSLTKLRQLGAI